MEHSFNVKFIIFDEQNTVSSEQEIFRRILIYDNLREILKKVFVNDENYFIYLNQI